MSDTTAGDEHEAAEIERLCEVMHDAYERAAVEEGWETQERSRTAWADVPPANQATMRAAVAALLEHLLAADWRRDGVARCATCSHPVSRHEAGECWTDTDGNSTRGETSCRCGWLEPESVANGPSPTPSETRQERIARAVVALRR